MLFQAQRFRKQTSTAHDRLSPPSHFHLRWANFVIATSWYPKSPVLRLKFRKLYFELLREPASFPLPNADVDYKQIGNPES